MSTSPGGSVHAPIRAFMFLTLLTFMENRGGANDLGMRVWIRERHDSLRVLAEQPKALRVYYEDLCDDTTATLARIHRFVGVEPQSLGGDFRADENHILGNSMRLDRVGAIVKSERWKTTLTAADLSRMDAVAFQSPEFVGVWYSHYRDQFAPWLIMQRGTDGELLALLTLAHDQRAGTLIVAGGHQAEYQAWLARSDRSEGFIAQAWHAIRKRLPATTLTFHYLPPTFPRGAWMAAPLRGLIEPSVRRRPLMQLLPERVEESLRKKSNKSKLNRLAKLGEVRLERLRSAQALDPWFDEIVTHYDLRQGATHDSCPFQTDAQKRAFHLALAEHPELLHVTVLSVGG